MAEYVIGSFIRSPAARRFRLVGFDASYEAKGWALKASHKVELDKLLTFVSRTTSFSYWLIGYASKVGPAGANERLSFNRAFSVQKYLAAGNSAFADDDRLEMFKGVGESGYQAAEQDNSWDWRAVEVHLFIGDVKPPKPPDVKPIPNVKPPLPGGQRFSRWAVASPGGGTATIGPKLGPLSAGLTVGFNIFFIRNEETSEVRGYVAPVAGPGASIGVPAKGWKDAVQTLLTAPNYGNMDFTTVFPRYAVTWEDVESCFVDVVGANAGIVLSVSAAVVTFNCPEIWHYGPSGLPLKTTEEIWSYNSPPARNWQIGAGAGGVTSRLIRID